MDVTKENGFREGFLARQQAKIADGAKLNLGDRIVFWFFPFCVGSGLEPFGFHLTVDTLPSGFPRRPSRYSRVRI
jgi:hypothetical protein